MMVLEVARKLPFEHYEARVLAQCATALVTLHPTFGKEALDVLKCITDRVVALDVSGWGGTSVAMLTALVRAESAAVHGPAGVALIQAITASVPQMGVVQLEMSAFSCARVAHLQMKQDKHLKASLDSAAEILLRYGTLKAERFLPRGLLNYFVAMERLSGRRAVRPLAAIVEERLLNMGASRLLGCSPFDRYRAALCLFRSGAEGPSVFTILLDAAVLNSISSYARESMAVRVQAAALKRPDPKWSVLTAAFTSPRKARGSKPGVKVNISTPKK